MCTALSVRQLASHASGRCYFNISSVFPAKQREIKRHLKHHVSTIGVKLKVFFHRFLSMNVLAHNYFSEFQCTCTV